MDFNSSLKWRVRLGIWKHYIYIKLYSKGKMEIMMKKIISKISLVLFFNFSIFFNRTVSKPYFRNLFLPVRARIFFWNSHVQWPLHSNLLTWKFCMPPSSGLQYAQDIFLFSICQEDLFVLVYSSCGCALRGHLIHPEWKMADEYFLRAHNKYIFNWMNGKGKAYFLYSKSMA